MNGHNNGYMSMIRYAVWTSEVNANAKPDLNEAFFVKRERTADDPLVIAGRRFAGPNRWPDDLPGSTSRYGHRVLTHVSAFGHGAEISADHLQQLSPLVVRHQLRRQAAGVTEPSRRQGHPPLMPMR